MSVARLAGSPSDLSGERCRGVAADPGSGKRSPGSSPRIYLPGHLQGQPGGASAARIGHWPVPEGADNFTAETTRRRIHWTRVVGRVVGAVGRVALATRPSIAASWPPGGVRCAEIPQ